MGHQGLEPRTNRLWAGCSRPTELMALLLPTFSLYTKPTQMSIPKIQISIYFFEMIILSPWFIKLLNDKTSQLNTLLMFIFTNYVPLHCLTAILPYKYNFTALYFSLSTFIYFLLSLYFIFSEHPHSFIKHCYYFTFLKYCIIQQKYSNHYDQ